MSSQRSGLRERLHANPSRMEQEIAIKLQDNQIPYQTQIEIPVTTANFYFPLEPRRLIVFIDGRVHLKTSQMTKDEETRTLLRKLFRQEERPTIPRNTGRNWAVIATIARDSADAARTACRRRVGIVLFLS